MLAGVITGQSGAKRVRPGAQLSQGPTERASEKVGDAREQGTEVPQKRRAGWAQSNEKVGQGSGEGVELGDPRRGLGRGQRTDGRRRRERQSGCPQQAAVAICHSRPRLEGAELETVRQVKGTVCSDSFSPNFTPKHTRAHVHTHVLAPVASSLFETLISVQVG